MGRRRKLLLISIGLALVIWGSMAEPVRQAEAGQAVEGRALVWQVGGPPGRAQGLGTLFWQTPGQEAVNLSDVPDEGSGTRVFPCGADAVSRDGTSLIAYIGPRTGGLYRVSLTGDTGEAGLVRWGDANVLACNGGGNAGFSPDGARWAYIAFADSAAGANYPDGMLHILDAADGSEQASFDRTVAFALDNDGATFVQFYTDSQGRADELALSRWDGTSAREMTSLTTDDSCYWTSARLAGRPDGDGQALAVGESCTGGSRWRVFSVGTDGSVTERVNLPSGGAFLPDSYSNQVVYLPDSTHLLAGYPNGRLKNVVNLVLVAPETNGVTLISPDVVADTFPDGRAEHIRVAPGGRAVAFVTATNRDDQAIHLLPLDGGIAPTTISAGPRGEVITVFFFTPDGSELLYVAGGRDGADNALYALAVGDYEPRLVARGNFLPLGGVVGDGVALLNEHVAPDDAHREAAANLVAVSLDDGTKTVIVDGRAANAWAFPLAWQ